MRDNKTVRYVFSVVCFLLGLVGLVFVVTTPATQASRPLYGANVHPWADFQSSVDYVAMTPGMGIVRYDEYVLTTSVLSVVAHYDYVKSKGLVSDIVLVQPCCDTNLMFGYVRALAVAMGPDRTPIVEILNEENASGYGNPWPATTYYQALYAARNALSQSGQHNLRISMGGLALNDTAYLNATGIAAGGAWLTDFGNGHFYTKGGNPTVGPLAPDDLDLAHGGVFSMTRGISSFQRIIPKPLIIGEWGWQTGEMPEGQRASYMRAVVSLARTHNVYALIVEEIGPGDGAGPNMRSTASWVAFSEAAVQ